MSRVDESRPCSSSMFTACSARTETEASRPPKSSRRPTIDWKHETGTLSGSPSFPGTKRWHEPGNWTPAPGETATRCLSSACRSASRTASTWRARRQRRDVPTSPIRPRRRTSRSPERSMPAPFSSARPTWTSSLRDWPGSERPMESPAILSTPASSPVDQARAQRFRSPPARSRSPSEPTPAGQVGSRRGSTTSSASSRLSVC